MNATQTCNHNLGGRMNYNSKDLQWLREIEDLDPHRSPSQRMQGIVLETIPIEESTLHIDDCYALIQAVIDFVNWALSEAFLLGGEFPQEALWAYYADYYRAEVSNGGHAQFVHNSGFTPIVVGSALRGLKAIGADEHHSILHDLAAALQCAHDKGDPLDDAIYAPFDARYFKTDSTSFLVSSLDTWLRGLACLEPLPVEELDQKLQAAKGRNKLFVARAEEMEHKRKLYEEGNATFRVTKSLCQSVGMRFLRFSTGAKLPMTMVSPSAPKRDEFCMGLLTDAGVHHIFFYEQKGFLRTRCIAELWAKDAPQPAAACAISRKDYEQILPPWLLISRK